MQFSSASILPYVAFNKDAFPQPPALQAGWTKSFSPPKQAQRQSRASFQAKFFQGRFQSANQAFVRFAVASSAALKSHRAQY
jgi:hypothetical protein